MSVAKKGKCSRKCKGFDLDMLMVVPIQKRTTIRAQLVALGMPHSTVNRLLKSGQLRAYTNSIKSALKPTHKIQRLSYVLTHVIPTNVHTLPKFFALHNIVHIDEKWFYMSQETLRFYL